MARYVFESGRWFKPYHWIAANGPIRTEENTDIVGLVLLLDPTFAPIYSPHGRVEFLQAFGITQSELNAIQEKTRTPQELVEFHRQTNPLLITELSRQDGE
ncbi:Suppressor of fused protein (SUFU) [Lignipirellula cremea]|uniref:Suppressor of fused protein (SUFU) n=2 Tax=Lignipirellula cremea TaxID=2528010 RepID=A0A518DP76_9BACT|nr:Suppressor of fused protein (SUFU) [Lignipirellula cremea]